jgi:hypothetical protein
MLAGTPEPVSSGLAGYGPRAAGAIPGVSAARLHGQLGRSRTVTAVGSGVNHTAARPRSANHRGRQRP